MTFKSNPHLPRMLLAAGLFVGVAAAQASSGFTITPNQEIRVTPGMTAAEVQQALGRPAQNIQYGNELGRTFTYQVIGSEQTLFDVDFGADGTVASVGERLIESTGGAHR
jgi:outer membrane protein assembly factor BamE (lipoprotein component of BamABCDE complex)